MEILLLVTIVIIAIAFINFKDYLNHPHKRPQINAQEDTQEFKQYQNPYKEQPNLQELSREEKIRDSEYGLIVALLAKLAQSDGKVCELELELMENTIMDITNALMLQSAMYQKDEILSILHQIFKETTQSVEELTMRYAAYTKGQYKSRLKLVEYMFSLAYADGKLGENEREIILDVAAYLEIDNTDFNTLYEEYEKFYANTIQAKDIQESYKILGVSEEDSIEHIKDAYKKLVQEYHPDILHHKGLDESIIEKYTQKLQEINTAYEAIKAHKNAQK
ncbi:molecular chaperone DjlA [Helicobacter sp. MIT 11-5569]|uniref:TerB family tellurite resistance protein n=1 Tax=Helicobacter sp. MIT 11-5569 TaxID=1548151 RepID=UPI00051FAC37|nr:TerB family tellurite resistance protein [Helicobacter sp. MIT 11-5569]TLD85291.1 molecular chaperone DjlA [Helicobacter sp. MIT 11-5569]